MNIDAQFPSKYLAATVDFTDEQDMILTIRDVTVEMVGQGDDAESKPIIYFEGVKKGFLCNKTNSKTIKNLYGPETNAWVGKKVALFATEVEYKGDQVMSIRVRIKAPQANGTGGTLAARYAALVARATELHLLFPVLDPAANDSETTAAGIALKAQIEAAEKQPAF